MLIFPVVMIAANIGAAVVYGCQSDYRRMIYFAASAICILAVTLR